MMVTGHNKFQNSKEIVSYMSQIQLYEGISHTKYCELYSEAPVSHHKLDGSVLSYIILTHSFVFVIISVAKNVN
jgi:hypothetical protein